MEVKVRVKKADIEKCETQLDLIELVSGEWLKQYHPLKRKEHELNIRNYVKSERRNKARMYWNVAKEPSKIVFQMVPR